MGTYRGYPRALKQQECLAKPLEPDERTVSKIYEHARILSRTVDHPVYRDARFIEELLKLEVEGLAPHYQPIHEKLKDFSAEMFEVMVAEYIRKYVAGFEVYRSHEPPFFHGEVDRYGRCESRGTLNVLVGSCKFRTADHRPE